MKEQVLLPIRPKSRGSPILQLWKKLLESCFKSQLHQILLIHSRVRSRDVKRSGKIQEIQPRSFYTQLTKYTDRDSGKNTADCCIFGLRCHNTWKNVKNNIKVICWIILFNYPIIFFSCVCSGRLYPDGTPHWEIW